MNPTDLVVETRIRTIGQLKREIKKCKKVYAWVNCYGDDGEYIEVSKASLLRAVGADVPNDGPHGGPPDGTAFYAKINWPEAYMYVVGNGR